MQELAIPVVQGLPLLHYLATHALQTCNLGLAMSSHQVVSNVYADSETRYSLKVACC